MQTSSLVGANGRTHAIVMFIVTLVLTMATTVTVAHASPLAKLRGSWGGSGTFSLADGSVERIRCNAYYTGGSSQLRLAIRCRSATTNIDIRSRLSHSRGNLSGTWEEGTYNAEGAAYGRISRRNLNLSIEGGGLSANMNVSFTSNRQRVSISVFGVPLQSVNISLRRR